MSDHFPVSLSFGRQLAKHSRFRIPEWAARHPLFLQAARERLDGLPPAAATLLGAVPTARNSARERPVARVGPHVRC